MEAIVDALDPATELIEPDPAVLIDLDRPEDYWKAIGDGPG